MGQAHFFYFYLHVHVSAYPEEQIRGVFYNNYEIVVYYFLIKHMLLVLRYSFSTFSTLIIVLL